MVYIIYNSHQAHACVAVHCSSAYFDTAVSLSLHDLHLTLLCLRPVPLQRSSPRSPRSPPRDSCKVSRWFGSRADGRGGSQAEPEHQSERVLLNINEVKVRDQLFFSLLFSLSLFFLFSLPKIVSKTLIRATKVQEIQHLHQIICRCKS